MAQEGMDTPQGRYVANDWANTKILLHHNYHCAYDYHIGHRLQPFLSSSPSFECQHKRSRLEDHMVLNFFIDCRAILTRCKLKMEVKHGVADDEAQHHHGETLADAAV